MREYRALCQLDSARARGAGAMVGMTRSTELAAEADRLWTEDCMEANGDTGRTWLESREVTDWVATSRAAEDPIRHTPSEGW